MSTRTNQEVILDTIDSLRRRKARPDLERICHMVERKYGVSAAEVECELERLVDDEVVFKVEYKGSTSYRNASKWKQSHLSGNRLNSADSSRLLLTAVGQLSRVGPTDARWATDGRRGPAAVPIEDIERHLLTLDPDTKLTVKMRLQIALDREVFSARLLKVGRGAYALPPTAEEEERSSPAGASEKVDRVKKRKRIRKTHGPDFEHEPLCKQPSYDQRCDYCSYNATCNKFGDAEELLVCKDCSLKVHPSCMRYSAELAEQSRLSPWQCMDCKTCLVCNESGDADKLLFCDSCDKGYHMACHHPPVSKKPEGKWVCFTCERDEEMEYYSSDGSAVLSSNDDFYSMQSSPSDTGTAPPLNDGSREISSTQGKISPDVATPSLTNAARLPEQSASAGSPPDFPLTDPAEWSIADVVRYFAVHGFPDQSTAFQEQEIDGKSLLLMRRLDVLTGLSLKLGPALKIYNHVMRLQLFCKHGCKQPNGSKAGKSVKGAASGSANKTAAKTSTAGASQTK